MNHTKRHTPHPAKLFYGESEHLVSGFLPVSIFGSHLFRLSLIVHTILSHFLAVDTWL